METASNDENVVNGSRRHERTVQYRKLMDHIGNSLSRENIDDMKFLAKEHIYPSHLLDRVTDGKAFIAFLEHKHLLAENSLHFLQTLLYYVARNDLHERVFRFRFDIQVNLRKNGVVIQDKYNLRQRPKELLQLPVEVKSFQNDLTPRSRFKNVNIPTMQMRLNNLATKLDSTRRRSTSKEQLCEDAIEDTRRDRAKTNMHSALDITTLQTEKLESLPELKPRKIHIPTENSNIQSQSRIATDSNEESFEQPSKNRTNEQAADVKMKKLRRRLNVNLTKQHQEGSVIIKHHYRKSKKHPKQTPFARKARESKGMISNDHVTNLLIKKVTPVIDNE